MAHARPFQTAPGTKAVPARSRRRANLAYPYAVEHNGKLYVGSSDNGGNIGRVGKGRELRNNNRAELVIVPLSALAAQQ